MFAGMERAPSGIGISTADLAGDVMGLWDQATRTIWLDSRLTFAERRCTLVHELVHAERGDIPCVDAVLDLRQERRVEREAARRLVNLEDLADAVRWSNDQAEVADALEVDLATLQARLAALSDTERAAVTRLPP